MFEFFTDNPVLVLVIIFVIVRLLRGNKSGARGVPGAKEQKDAVPRRRETRASKLRELKAALEEASRQADSGRSGVLQGISADISPAVPPSLPASPEDPFAFRSLMNREEQRVADSSRTDYDISAVDYDARSDAFNFRSSSSEPTEQEYHLTGFSAFRRAGGLTTDPVKVRAVGEESQPEQEVDPLQMALSDPDQMRRDILLHEILERPVSMRR